MTDKSPVKIAVMSGKGGVGKSSVAVNLAVALSLQGLKTALLDVDIHGPSVPLMLKLKDIKACIENDMYIPYEIGNLKVMSIGFFLQNSDDAVIWRGPAKASMIRNFASATNWGEIDCMVIDCPPGTGDEPLSVVQELKPDGAVIITTPQQAALEDVKKSIKFCQQTELPVVGVIENMSSFVCPHCGKDTAIFSSGGGKELSKNYGIPLLGSIPIDPNIVTASDSGMPYIYHFSESPAAKIFKDIVSKIMENVKLTEGELR